MTSQQAVLEAVTQLGRRLEVPVLAENDADLGALGEAIFGAGGSADSIVYLKLVRFLGAGLVIDGKLHTGARGMAGELAHVSVVEHGARCFCGGAGCLGMVLGPRYQQFLESTYGTNITISEAMERADAGDVRARSAIEEIGRLIGRPLSALCTIIDPVAVVLDGNLGKSAQYIKTGIEDTMDVYAPVLKLEGMEVRTGGLGRDAEFHGSIALFRDAYIEALCGPE
jgi:predicted NBD/HSP70 family sugar kinase